MFHLNLRLRNYAINCSLFMLGASNPFCAAEGSAICGGKMVGSCTSIVLQ